MRTTAIKITPEDYILSVLTPEERLAAAFRVAEAAFKGINLTMKDVENADKTIRRKANATKKRLVRKTGVRLTLYINICIIARA